VARQASLELLDAMALSPIKERDPAVALLLYGLKAEPEAAQAFAIHVAEVARESRSAPLQKFASDLSNMLPAVKQ
jgi:hypothetical protein